MYETDFDILQLLSLEVCYRLLQLPDAALSIAGDRLRVNSCLPINTQLYLPVCVCYFSAQACDDIHEMVYAPETERSRQGDVLK